MVSIDVRFCLVLFPIMSGLASGMISMEVQTKVSKNP